jgi:hypothetical protein
MDKFTKEDISKFDLILESPIGIFYYFALSSIDRTKYHIYTAYFNIETKKCKYVRKGKFSSFKKIG